MSFTHINIGQSQFFFFFIDPKRKKKKNAELALTLKKSDEHSYYEKCLAMSIRHDRHFNIQADGMFGICIKSFYLYV